MMKKNFKLILFYNFIILSLSLSLKAMDDVILRDSEINETQIQKNILKKKLINEILNSCSQHDKDHIERIIKRLKDPMRYRYNPKTLLILDPNGVGKTTLAQAIAQQSDANYFIFDKDMIKKGLRTSGNENLFNKLQSIDLQAAQKNKMHIIVLDGITKIIDSKKTYLDNMLCDMIDFFNEKLIHIIITMRDSENLSDRLKNRLHYSVIKIDLPNKKMRENIINYYLSDVSNNISNNYKINLSSKLRGFSGKKIEALLNESKKHAEDRLENNNILVVDQKDIENSLKILKPYGLMKYLLKTSPFCKKIKNFCELFGPKEIFSIMQLTLQAMQLYFSIKQYQLQEKQIAFYKFPAKHFNIPQENIKTTLVDLNFQKNRGLLHLV